MLDVLLSQAAARWAFDPADGIQVVNAERLTATPIEPTRPLLIVPAETLLAPGTSASPSNAGPLPGRNGPTGRDPITVLARLYPSGHTVARLEGRAGSTTIEGLRPADLNGPLYLPPASPEHAVATPWALPWISTRLRQPDGCPWDAGATPALAEELGDLLLQVILHAQLAAEEGVFDLTDVQAAIGSKIVRRHPHVFGDAEARTAGDVNRQWERIKSAERLAAAEAAALADEAGSPAPPKSALDGISPSLPSLAASQEMQERAANLGYDWPSIEGVLDKVREELDELRAAGSATERAEEFGDLLMVLVNVARKEGIEAEAALRSANDKFRRRFRSVERQAADRGAALRDLDFAALDELWDAAKVEERSPQVEEARR